MKVSNDNWDRTSELPICLKHVVLPNVVDTIILVIIIIIIIIIKLLIVVFWRCIHVAHWFGYSNIATGMTHPIKKTVEGKNHKWWPVVGM